MTRLGDSPRGRVPRSSPLPWSLLLLQCCVLSLWLTAAATGAQPPTATDTAGEAANIQRERQSVEQRYQALRLDCAGRFALTACLERARGTRRQALDALAQREAVFDDVQRRARAAERLAAIDAKVRARAQAGAAAAAASAAAAVPAAPTSAALVATPAAAGVSAASAATASRRAARLASAPASAAPVRHAAPMAAASAAGPSVAELARRRADHQRRQQAAEAHRRAVLQRDAERSARKPPAAPLPLPGSASAPAGLAR